MRILLTGATGYVGGYVLTTLLTSPHPLVSNCEITVLVRKQSQADALTAHGAAPILFSDLDDADALRRAAAEHDVVIHAASGFHGRSAEALIVGLGERRARFGSEVHFIQTSGTWSLADGALLDRDDQLRVFSDTDDDIFTLERRLECISSFSQRAVDLAVVDAAHAAGVKSYIVMPPDVYGVGTGLFNTLSPQIPNFVRHAIEHKEAAYVEDGFGEVGHVHIADLAAFYQVLLGRILEGGVCASGVEGIYFCSDRPRKWRDVASAIGSIGFSRGLLRMEVPRAIRVEEAAGRWTGGDEGDLQRGYCSRFFTRPDRAVSMGWEPTKTGEEWEQWILESFELVSANMAKK